MSHIVGHRCETMPNGKDIVDYIMPTIFQESQLYGGIKLPSKEQVALVISALRMLSLLEYASKYDFSMLGHPDQATKFHPTELSIGRFFRDASMKVLNEYAIEKRK